MKITRSRAPRVNYLVVVISTRCTPENHFWLLWMRDWKCDLLIEMGAELGKWK